MSLEQAQEHLKDMGKGTATIKRRSAVFDTGRVYVYYNTENPTDEISFTFDMETLKKELGEHLHDAMILEHIESLSQEELDKLIDKKIHIGKGIMTSIVSQEDPEFFSHQSIKGKVPT
jgi:hypothetical protein